MSFYPNKTELSDIIQWDVKTWSKCLDFWGNPERFKNKRVLAIGEREGGLSLYFAKCGAEVVCTDFNEFPEATKAMHQKYGVQDHITYQEGVDATDLSRYANESFDIVVFKSVIGALSTKERQSQAINEMYRLLKVGGELLFAENLMGTKLHGWLRKKFIRWDSYWRYLHLKKDQDLFAEFSEKHQKSVGVFALFGRSEQQRKFLAGLDKGIAWMVPKSWKYVLIGRMIK